MTVYVVTEGEYSDYHICGVFSTQEKADAYVAAATTTHSQPRIETFELDTLIPPKSGRVYYAVINNADGSIYRQFEYVEIIEDGRRSWTEEWGSNKTLAASTVSADHACKVAVEARQADLRKELDELHRTKDHLLNVQESTRLYLETGKIASEYRD